MCFCLSCLCAKRKCNGIVRRPKPQWLNKTVTAIFLFLYLPVVYKCLKGSSVHSCPSESISTQQQWEESVATCTQTWTLSRSNVMEAQP